MNAARLARSASLTVLALGLATLAWGSGMDRMARAAPALARNVPEPLRAHAWRAEAMRALEQNPKRAEALAARAVIADPVDPASASLLGTARFAQSDGPGAATAFRVAGTLGWRDQPTQLYWLLAALEAGDYAVATERLDAMLRQAPTNPQGGMLLGQLGATLAGRAALAKRLAARSNWFHVYLSTFDGVSPAQLADRAAVLDEPAMEPAKVACTEIGPLAGALYGQGRAVEARRLWLSHCGAREALLADGGFDAARLNETSPFAWQFMGEGGLDLRLDPAAQGVGRSNAGQALVAASTLPQRRVIAVQSVQLGAGRYRLAWRASDASGAPTARIAARLTCKRGEGAWPESAVRGDGLRAALVDVPPGCVVQWVELALDPGSGAVSLEEVRLVPAN